MWWDQESERSTLSCTPRLQAHAGGVGITMDPSANCERLLLLSSPSTHGPLPFPSPAPHKALLLLPTMPLPHLLRPAHLDYLRSLQTFDPEFHQGALWAHAHRGASQFVLCSSLQPLWLAPPSGVLDFLLMDVGSVTGVP